MYFETKHKAVFSPKNSLLNEFYRILEKYSSTIGDSRMFEDFVEVYETLDADLEEGITDEII